MAKKKNRQSNIPGDARRDSSIESTTDSETRDAGRLTKFEIYGEEMIEKRVNLCGNSGRVYLPSEWVGHKVKIARID